MCSPGRTCSEDASAIRTHGWRVWISRRRHAFQDGGQHLVGRDAAGFSFKAEQHAMTQRIEQDGLYIIRADEVFAVNPGVRAGAAIQCNGATRADRKSTRLNSSHVRI